MHITIDHGPSHDSLLFLHIQIVLSSLSRSRPSSSVCVSPLFTTLAPFSIFNLRPLFSFPFCPSVLGSPKFLIDFDLKEFPSPRVRLCWLTQLLFRVFPPLFLSWKRPFRNCASLHSPLSLTLFPFHFPLQCVPFPFRNSCQFHQFAPITPCSLIISLSSPSSWSSLPSATFSSLYSLFSSSSGSNTGYSFFIFISTFPPSNISRMTSMLTTVNGCKFCDIAKNKKELILKEKEKVWLSH